MASYLWMITLHWHFLTLFDVAYVMFFTSRSLGIVAPLSPLQVVSRDCLNDGKFGVSTLTHALWWNNVKKCSQHAAKFGIVHYHWGAFNGSKMCPIQYSLFFFLLLNSHTLFFSFPNFSLLLVNKKQNKQNHNTFFKLMPQLFLLHAWGLYCVGY